MPDDCYRTLAEVLDTLPNGFPASPTGVELRLLKRIFRPRDIPIFCSLRLEFETAEQVSRRTGRPLEGLEAHLTDMWHRGQIMGADIGGLRVFRMVPWAFGIYEFQLPHMDREMARMCEEYMGTFRGQFFSRSPQLMQVVPVEREIRGRQETLSYEQVSHIIENSRSFMVFDCICKKEQRLLGKGCDKPLEVCTAYAPIAGVFEKAGYGRCIGKAQAYEILGMAEEAALVHLTWNVQSGHYFICNCCGCCCNVLKNISQSRMPASQVINSYYTAEIDPGLCTACGTCREARCQVGAIEAAVDAYRVVRETCIGCGLCVASCPVDAIRLVRKPPEEVVPPPADEAEWYRRRAEGRGVDYSAYR